MKYREVAQAQCDTLNDLLKYGSCDMDRLEMLMSANKVLSEIEGMPLIECGLCGPDAVFMVAETK